MPSEYAETVQTAQRAVASASFVVETGVALWMMNKQASSEEAVAANPWLAAMNNQHAEVLNRVEGFWTGTKAAHDWLEFFVAAERTGSLSDDTLDTLLDGFDAAMEEDLGIPTLATETTEANRILAERMRALAASTELRSAYKAVVRDAADCIRPFWEAEGRRLASARADAVSRQLEQTHDVLSPLPAGNIARNEVYAALMETELVEKQALIYPAYFGGRSSGVVSLSEVVVIFQGLQWDVTDAKRRENAKLAAQRFKVLSDPTRLAILSLLTHQPTSIRDLAQRFDLSQPTISTHVKMLREADLLESTQVGNLTLYRAATGDIRLWISEGVNTLFEEGVEPPELCPIVNGLEFPSS